MNLAEVDFRPYVSYKADNIILLQIVYLVAYYFQNRKDKFAEIKSRAYFEAI